MSTLCRIPLRVLLSLLFVPTAAAQVVFEDDFENGLAAWTRTSNRWHVETESDPCGSLWQPFPSGDACARYGLLDTCAYSNFQNGSGELRSPGIALPVSDGLRRPELRFVYRYEVGDADEEYDCAHVLVDDTPLEEWCSGPGGTTTYPQYGRWGVARRDLSAYAGQSVEVSFTFWHDQFYSNGAGFLIDDVWVGLVAGTAFCDAVLEGVPSSSNCPCEPATEGWHPDSGGCLNSRGMRAELFGVGLPSLSADDLQLQVSGLRKNSPALLVQGGVTHDPIVFGDGIWCLAAPVRRLLFQQAVQGRLSYPAPGQQPLSVLGGVAVGETVGYQVYHRDQSPTHCTPARFNVSNGYAVTWAP